MSSVCERICAVASVCKNRRYRPFTDGGISYTSATHSFAQYQTRLCEIDLACPTVPISDIKTSLLCIAALAVVLYTRPLQHLVSSEIDLTIRRMFAAYIKLYSDDFDILGSHVTHHPQSVCIVQPSASRPNPPESRPPQSAYIPASAPCKPHPSEMCVHLATQDVDFFHQRGQWRSIAFRQVP